MSAAGQFLAQPAVVRLPAPGGATDREESPLLPGSDAVPGVLRAFFRDRKGHWIHTSDSVNDGWTWESKPRKTGVVNNQSGIAALLLASGRLLLAFNNVRCTPPPPHARSRHGLPPQPVCPRHPLSLALSEDHGRSWRWVRDLEAGGSSDPAPPPRRAPHLHRYSYPSLAQDLETGMVHVAYTYRKRFIKHVVVDEAWVMRGGTSGMFKGAG